MSTKSWYERLRSKYRPKKTRILLIGESPPDPRSHERRFFFSSVLKADNLYRSVAMALYGRERAFDVKHKVENLERMKRDGVWLLDAVSHPVNLHSKAERRRAIREGADYLVKRVKKLSPATGVIICHSVVYRECADSLRQAGITVLHKKALPFPLGNTRAQFIAGMRSALKKVAEHKT